MNKIENNKVMGHKSFIYSKLKKIKFKIWFKYFCNKWWKSRKKFQPFFLLTLTAYELEINNPKIK